MSSRYNLRGRNRNGAKGTRESENAPPAKNGNQIGRRLSGLFLGKRARGNGGEVQIAQEGQARLSEQAEQGAAISQTDSSKRKSPSSASSYYSSTSSSETDQFQPAKRRRKSLRTYAQELKLIPDLNLTMTRPRAKKERRKKIRLSPEEADAWVAEHCDEAWRAAATKQMEDFHEEYQRFLVQCDGPPGYSPPVKQTTYVPLDDGRVGWVCPPPFMVDVPPPTEEKPFPTYYTEGYWSVGDGHLLSDKPGTSKTGTEVTRLQEGDVDIEMSGANELGEGVDSDSEDKPKPGTSNTKTSRGTAQNQESAELPASADSGNISVSSALRRLSLGDPAAAAQPKFLDYPVQDPPILMFDDIPAELNWDINDDDLDEGDIEANIARCHQRIKTGIIPQRWEMRLKRYQAMKEDQEAMMATEPEGLSLPVVKRLKDLEAIAKEFETMEDVLDHHIKNVHGIMEAYRSGKMGWEKGKVVCFYKGKPLGTWKRMTLEEINEVCLAHENQVWVEGLYGPAAAFHGFAGNVVLENAAQPDWPTIHLVPTLIGIRGQTKRVRMEFRDDTGADFMTLFMEDVDEIRSGVDTTQHDVIDYGFMRNQGVSGTFISWVIGLEMKILDDMVAGNHMTSFKVQPMVVMPRGHAPRTGFSQRLSGSWWRSALYTASAPDNNHRLYVSQTKDGLGKMLPNVDFNAALKQPTPHYILEHGLGQEFLEQEKQGDPMETES